MQFQILTKARLAVKSRLQSDLILCRANLSDRSYPTKLANFKIAKASILKLMQSIKKKKKLCCRKERLQLSQSPAILLTRAARTTHKLESTVWSINCDHMSLTDQYRKGPVLYYSVLLLAVNHSFFSRIKCHNRKVICCLRHPTCRPISWAPRDAHIDQTPKLCNRIACKKKKKTMKTSVRPKHKNSQHRQTFKMRWLNYPRSKI